MDWDPNPHERTYYRSRQDGQRAYLVKRLGKDVLRLDRPMEEILVNASSDGQFHGWSKDSQTHPMTPHQAAKVAYCADLALRQVMGEHVKRNSEWIDLHERDKIRFMQYGPQSDTIRDTLFLAITKVLEELTGGREG